MPAAQPAHHAGGDIWIRQVHHCWRYDQDPRLWLAEGKRRNAEFAPAHPSSSGYFDPGNGGTKFHEA
jgi:hypothetical protein